MHRGGADAPRGFLWLRVACVHRPLHVRGIGWERGALPALLDESAASPDVYDRGVWNVLTHIAITVSNARPATGMGGPGAAMCDVRRATRAVHAAL
ncbi:MAG: hypothetical protein NVS2B16_34620 [Chloroflexota bacterium]